MKYLLAALCLAAISHTAHATEFEGSAQPADVLAAVTRFADDLESVRDYMGKPGVTLRRFEVEFAAPRHVYYQAQTLYRKISRLGAEVGALSQQPAPTPPVGEILPQDVLRMVALAQRRLDLIRETLGVGTVSPAPKRDPRTEPKDVFEAMVAANRQINLMLNERFQPVDVYAQLTLVNVYLAGVLAHAKLPPFPEATFEPNKRPGDVYDKLVECLLLNQRVGQLMDTSTLRINARKLRRESSSLSDNYDIATMLVSDVAGWTGELEYSEDVFAADDTPRHIFPAHVLARASAVEMQLQQIVAALQDGRVKRSANGASGN